MEQGDELAAEIFDIVGTYLGRGLSVLIDILNPEMIVIGSIYARQKNVLDKKMREALEQEALPVSRKACRIVPASLGELIGGLRGGFRRNQGLSGSVPACGAVQRADEVGYGGISDMKLLTNIYQVGGPSLTHFFDATVTLLKGKDGWFLIDCGTPEGYEQVKENIRKAGVEPSQIKFILGTHGHYDHVGAAHLWKEEFGCRLFLHALDRSRWKRGIP